MSVSHTSENRESKEIKDWADTLNEHVTECLMPSSDSSDRKDKNIPLGLDSFHQVFDVQKLYRKLEDDITLKYFNGNNFRNVLSEEKKTQDLLNLMRDAGDTVEKKIGAVLAVSLSGIISARYDSNYRTVLEMLEWSNEALPEGFKSNQFLVLRIAECYTEFGKVRHGGTHTRLPGIDDLNDFMAEAKLEEEEQKTDYAVYLNLFLIDSVAQLPPHLLSNELAEYSSWLEEVENETKERAPARFSYYLSRVAYSQNKLDEAIIYAMDALQAAPARSGDFINRCRQHLLALEQEKAARYIIKSESVKEAVEESVAKADEKLQDMLNEAQSKFDDKISEVEIKMREDTKDSLLRVIEILGIFLAVAGVVATEVGGLTAGNSLGQTLTIYIVGNATVLMLFLFLRFMVLKPLVVRRRENKQTEASRSTISAHVRNEKMESNDGNQTTN